MPRVIPTVLVLLMQVQPPALAGKPCPYVIVTAAGERIGSLDAPRHDGRPVKFRYCANGSLTLVAASTVDWPATEKANAALVAAAASTPTPLALPTKPSLARMAGEMKLRHADEAVKKNEGAGKMKVGAKEMDVDDKAPFFGKDSIAQYVSLGSFVADISGCPSTRARAYGTVKNISRLKLRNLKAYVAIGSLRSGDMNGQVQTMDPSDLVPGGESEIFVYLSCDWVEKLSQKYRLKDQGIVVFIADVAGRTEEVARPDGSNPFDPPAKAPPAKMPVKKP